MESEVGQGTTFTFEIQVKPGDQSTILTQQSTISRRVVELVPGQPRYRILVADDNRDSRQLLVKLLNPLGPSTTSGQGFDLREAGNGQEAIAIWEEWQPHLIWMDMRMPVMDGYEATKRIRELERQKAKGKRQKEDTLHPSPFALRPVPIIALTASSYEEERMVVLAAGCDDYLRKPFRERDVFELMHKHLGVQYVYEEEKNSKFEIRNSKFEEVLTPAALAGLPPEVLDKLEQAAIQGDTALVKMVIQDIRQEHDALADGLTALVHEFDYGKIGELIQTAKKI